MAARQLIGQGLGAMLGLVPSAASGLPQASRLLSVSAFRLWPDVVVPSMGESATEGAVSVVLKQVGDTVKEDEDIAQVEAGKAAIGIKAPVAGVLERLLIKPDDTVVAGQVVAVIGAAAPVAAAGGVPAAAPAAAAAAAPAHASSSGRSPMIKFPPRVTAAGARISDLPAAEYAAAVAAASPAAAPVAPQAPAAAAAPPPPPAAARPVPAAKAAAPPQTKNKLTYVTRPDGRGGPPRRELTDRELDMINLGGAY